VSAENGSDHRPDDVRAPEEQVVDDVERVAEDLAARASRWAVRFAARAREEMEDIWAEAQSIRHGD
jgi:hypothetical protein